MKKDFFTGLIILLPIALTIFIIAWIVLFFTAPIMPLVLYGLHHLESAFFIMLPDSVMQLLSRLIALTVLVFFILALGMVARSIFMRSVIQALHQFLSRIPFIKTVLHLSHDIFSALFSEKEKKLFQQPVSIAFPIEPNRVIGFHVGNAPEECQSKVEEPFIAIFMPTAPHPISGFLLLVNRKKVNFLDMSNEEALKFLVTCGVITPDSHEQP
jgi:uncharacterized membrane protein